MWRHALSHGGINDRPPPPRVEAGVKKLGPRLLRTFIQEFFGVFPDHGRFDWSRLDPYLESLERTGAKVVAAITIKPPVLFRRVDHAVWQPRDGGEWQRLLSELVKRYSVDKPIVTYPGFFTGVAPFRHSERSEESPPHEAGRDSSTSSE